MATRTGNFAVGFRRGWAEFQKDLTALIDWAKENDFECIDTGKSVEDAKQVADSGLRLGSADLLEWQGMISKDSGKRKDAVAANADYIKDCASIGTVNHFCVMLPEDPELDRKENFDYMVESFSELAPIMEEHNARLVIEGWPGPGALCCTPEGYREFFKQVSSPAMGVNYDPSHLIRMGIDPIRFLKEFVDRVYHVHGKDTSLCAEHLYQFGHEQPPTFAAPVGFGTPVWRYTIPGHGIMNWVACFEILNAHGYDGCVSIELEDCNFNDTDDKAGLIFGRKYLESC